MAKQITQEPYVPPQPLDGGEPIGRVPKEVRGNGPPKDPRQEFERGLLHFDALSAERDALERDLKAAQLKISQLELQLTEIEATRNTIESRINSCVLERDGAVSQAGELRGALNSVAAICIRYHDAQQD
jgi:chromosome segregation ATPase